MKNLTKLAAMAAIVSVAFSCNKMENTPMSDVRIPEPAPPTKAYGDNTPLVMTYVEINDTNPLNAGDYIDGNGKPLFDIVEFFAANIHAETVNGQTRPTLYLNDKMTPVLEGGAAENYVRPLQNLGIKVLLTVLGDWAGVGVANMDETQAEQFATILAYAVEKYGFDGIGFDDEYANYQSGLVDGSFGNVIKKLHAKMPADKLITVFTFGNTYLIDADAGALVDYAYTNFTYWNGTPGIAGVNNSRWAPSAYNLGSSQTASLVTYYAQKAKNEGYGAIMNFNIRQKSDKDPLPTLQAISSGLGRGTVTCRNGDRNRDTGSVTGGYTINYSTATGN